ncbi:hypothetical protein ACVIHC_004591 [Bradyrhizobium diazoefficiens]
MKKEVGTLVATPSKRLFLSIIADYDLNRSICELVDNGLDVWVRAGRRSKVAVEVTLNSDQNIICVEDNAGGLRRTELRYIVGPGQTGSAPTDETIGIFGVGTKRAVVALAQDVKISTRFGNDDTFQVDFDENWLEEEDWELPLYQVDNIAPSTTIVELQKLRVKISDEVIDQLREHLSVTYAKFLSTNGVSISLNGKALKPQFFDGWSYPPGYEPRRYHGVLKTAEGRDVRVEAIAGLSDESSPAGGEYGVYFYCNDRLIARALKTFEVGFMKGYAGLPHPKVSLTKVLVSLSGDASSMPWNSSKSDISTKHEVFQALHTWLTQAVKDYAALSRIWMGEWPDKVFKYAEGKVVDVPVDDFPTAKKSYLPPMPKSRPRYGDVITDVNKGVAKKKPWVKGLYEGVIAADLIAKQHLEQRNRIALIVLDSTVEIAFKEFLVHDSGVHYTDSQLLAIFKTRHTVHTEIRKYSQVKISADMWKKITHYSDLRNKLIHQRATAGVSDKEVGDFREVVEVVLKKLYKLKF